MIHRYSTLRRFHVTEMILIEYIMIENRRANQIQLKGGLFDNMYHLWHRFSEQINLANVHSPQI